MAKKHFHIAYPIIKSNKVNFLDGRPGDHQPPLRIAVDGSAPGVNRMFYEAIILGQDGLPACTFAYDGLNDSPENFNPRIDTRAGMWTNGAVIIDGVRIE